VERDRQRRSDILQRILFLALRSTIGASHAGVKIYYAREKRTLTAFPRVLAYSANQPEKRAVLCMKGVQSQQPCSSCDVQRDVSGSVEAADVKEHNAIDVLQKQWEAPSHRRRAVKRARRINLEATNSINSVMPVLSCMTGLSTAPHLMYKKIAFDSLHVCFFGLSTLFSLVCLAYAHSRYLCIRLTPD